MKDRYLAIISSLVTIVIMYIVLLVYNFSNLHNEFAYNFKSLENLNFHEKYSEKIHHIREEMV